MKKNRRVKTPYKVEMTREEKLKHESFYLNFPKGKTPEYIAYVFGCGQTQYVGEEGGGSYVIVNTRNEGVTANAKGFPHTTTNRMELLSAISAITQIPKDKSVEVRTSSKYCVGAAFGGKYRANPDLVKMLRDTIKDRSVYLRWVRCSEGDDYSKMSRRLARDAMLAVIGRDKEEASRYF